MTKEKRIETTWDFVNQQMLIDQTEFVESEYDEECILNNSMMVDESDLDNVVKWFLVNDDLAKKLMDKGQVIFESSEKAWWGCMQSDPCLSLALQEIACEAA